MKRRDFIKSTLALSTMAGLSASAAEANASQEYDQLRGYRLKPGADHAVLDKYLEKAAIPALNRLGSKTVGVFTNPDAKETPAVYVLIPYANLDALFTTSSKLRADTEYVQAARDYMQAPKSNPAYDRIDTWVMLAFAGIPHLELPAYSREKVASRVFEIRTYESHSESKAMKKVEMFNGGEIDVMREVGLGPIFFGQALVGANLPHLTYMLSAESRDAHKEHWGAFGKHPTWKKMSSDPQYADTVSKIANFILTPTSYSQI